MNLLPTMQGNKEELIERLILSINKLQNLYEKEKEARKKLEAINAELLQQLNKKNDEIEALEVKINTLKLAKSLSGLNDMHDAKLKVTNLVREIDKCIALLNR